MTGKKLAKSHNTLAGGRPDEAGSDADRDGGVGDQGSLGRRNSRSPRQDSGGRGGAAPAADCSAAGPGITVILITYKLADR